MTVQIDIWLVGRWTRDASILDKAYLLFPIIENGHWSLAIICHPGGSNRKNGSKRCLLHLDSNTGTHDSKLIFQALRRFLKAAWERAKGADERFNDEDIVQCSAPVADQQNAYDCGPFVLHSIDKFVREAPTVFTTQELSKYTDSAVSCDNSMDLCTVTARCKPKLQRP